MNYRFFVEVTDYAKRASIYIAEDLGNGEFNHLEPLEITTTKMEAGGSTVGKSPFLSLEEDDAQGLFMEMWRAGFRPGNDGDETATKYHLEDMRKIAFNKLGIKNV